ncbi:sperm-associated antigen 17 isoform X1 [Nothobranchius furzeri]
MQAGKKGSAKKPRATPGTPAGNKTFEAELIKAQFHEGSWQACVSLLVGRSPEEEKQLVSPLARAVLKPQRKLFTILSRDNVLLKIRELGNPRAKKSDHLPMFYEITEAAKALLDAGEEIPCDLMTKVLKFMLLQIKASDKHRREGEQLKTEGREEKVVPPSDNKAKGSNRKPKGSSSAVEGSKQKKTGLKRRDDVDPPTFIDDEPDPGPHHYILLVGFYQPQLIPLLDEVGVHVANVIQLCSEQAQTRAEEQGHRSEENRPSTRAPQVLDAEITLKVKRFWSGLRAALDSGPPDSRLHDVVQLSYTVPDLTSCLQTHDSDAVLSLGSRIFEGVANLIYDCLDWRRQHQHYRDNVKLLSVPCVGRDSQPEQFTKTTHQDSLESTVLPTQRTKKMNREPAPPEPESKLPPLCVDRRYYSNLLDQVPPEACSVPLIMNCMLEQVVLTLSQTPEEPKPVSGGPWLDPQHASCLQENFLPLLHTEDERNQRLTDVLTLAQKEEDIKMLMETSGDRKSQKKSEQLQVIAHNDERALRLRGVTADDGFSPAEVEVSMMRFSPVLDLTQPKAQGRNSATCWMTDKQQLQHFCTDDEVSWPDVERLFHQSVFEAMVLKTVDQHGVLLNNPGTEEHTSDVIPWDNPLLYAKQQLHKLRTEGPAFLTEDPGDSEQQSSGNVCHQLDLSDIQRCRRRSLVDWHYAEHHSSAVLPQVLMSASEEYQCLDTFRGSHENIVYVFCHNPMNSQRRSKELWGVALHTDVKFRKYLEHVAETVSDWTREEELKREKALIRTQSPAESLKDEKASCSMMEKMTLEPIIRKDSLKAWRLEQEQLKEEEMLKRSKNKNTPKAKQQKEEAMGNKESKDLSGVKKSRVDTTSTFAKAPSSAAPTTSMGNQDPPPREEPLSRFTGYSMNGRLIHVSGCTQHLYPSDGGVITVETISFTEGSTLMKVAVKKDGHHFYTHINQAAADPSKSSSQPADRGNVRPDEDSEEVESGVMKTVKQGTFSAVLDKKLHLSYSFYGPTGEHTVSSEEGPEETSKPPCRRQVQSSQGCEEPSGPFNSLSLSVPNGLLLQFLREETEGVSAEERGILVKQSFPVHGEGQRLQDVSLSKELHRTITSQGAVIRYMRDGSKEVLFANGSVSFSQDSGPVWVPDAEAAKLQKDQTSERDTDAQKGVWQTTGPSGNRVCTVGTTHQHLPTTPLLTFKATDPFTHQVLQRREDPVVLVQNPDGSLVVEHADGTRISSFLRDRPATGEKTACQCTSSRVCVHRKVDHACDGGQKISSNRSSDDGQTGCPKKTGGEKGGVSTKEQVVLVEKDGCASVEMWPERHTAHVRLADGTVITGTNRADYKVCCRPVGVLQVQSDGSCLYSSHAPVCCSSNQPGVYMMSYTHSVACDVTDEDGNHFQVFEDGRISVVPFSPVPIIQTPEEEGQEKAGLRGRHCPRLFLVHEDGSGSELLSRHAVEELLKQSRSDPTIAVLKEPLPHKQDEFGITILKPSRRSVWAQWLLKKQIPDITPPSLRNRTWHDFPAVERKKASPPFGSKAGVGLTLEERSSGSAAQHQRVLSCPEVLEVRELYQHRPFTTPLTNTIDARLKEYMERLMARELLSEEMKVKEHHSEEEEEGVHISDLLSFNLCFAEEDEARRTSATRVSADLADLYIQVVEASLERSDVSEADDMDADSLDGSQQVTEERVSRWTERHAQHRRELSEEKTYREALRERIVVPYFHPENLPLHRSLLRGQKPETRSSSLKLPLEVDSSETDGRNVSEDSTPPLTPPHSQSHAAETKMPENGATNRRSQRTGESSRRSSQRKSESVQPDVTERPRQTKVQPPPGSLGPETHSEPNPHFEATQESVRRTCGPVSLTSPSSVVRSFLLRPSSVDFGTLRDGTSSSRTVIMKNVGVDRSRFLVKPPPPATGLRVLYSPGPVAAGLHAELHIQLFAMHDVQLDVAEPKTYFSHDIVIHTETDSLYLPVTAIILPEELHDEECMSAHRKSGSKTIQAHSWSGNRSDEPPCS